MGITKRINSPMAFSRWRVAGALVLASLLVFLFVFAPTAPAQTFTLLYQFRSGPGGINPYAGVVRDTKGNLYGTTYNDGAFASGTVFRITPAGKEKVLHSFSQTDGDGAFPWYGTLARDSSGNLYGTTITGGIKGQLCCGTVFRVTASGEETVLYRFNGIDGDGFPQDGVVRDSSGNLYGTTQNGGPNNAGTVFKVDPTGKKTALYSFTGSADGAYPMAGVVLDAKGNLYGTTSGGGSSSYAGTVFKVDPTGKETVLYTFTGSNDGGIPEAGVIRDSHGNLYGTTYSGGTDGLGTVFKVNTQGQETVLHNFAGTNDGWLPLGGSLVRDSAGNLYGTTPQGSTSFGVVFKIDPKGNETIIHNFSGKDGKIPYGTLVLDKAGNLYGTASEGGAYGGGVIFKLTLN